MFDIFRIKGGVSWTVRLNKRNVVAFATRKEAQAYISEMTEKYGYLLCD